MIAVMSKLSKRHLRPVVLAMVALTIVTEGLLADYDEVVYCGFVSRSTYQRDKEQGNENKYAPDRKVDILHIKIDVTPDFDKRTVAGAATITFKPIAKTLDELVLDAYDLRVSSITGSVHIAGYNVTDEDITITFSKPVVPDKETSITVVYEAEPENGLYFRTPAMGYRPEDEHLFTQGESHSAPNWFPNYDYPNERSTSEVICRAPADMVILSNGKLISEKIDEESGLKISHWYQDKPHVNYLIALVAGKFKKVESMYKGIELAFYTPASQIEQAQNSFKDTADIMKFFEEEIDIDYPWSKYYQVVVNDFVAGGMENTTLTILSDYTLFKDETENIHSSQKLVAHELAHMWFGDYVTCKDWSHIWLNEGFATYYAHLYDGYKNGRDSMLYGLYLDAAKRVLSDRSSHKPMVYRSYRNPWEQFDYRAYLKGGWVLHMLRTDLGDELFRKCIKTYMERNAFDSVVTEDLNTVIEELTGRTYDRFFDQWVYHARHPDLTVKYKWEQKDKLAKVSVEQTQECDNNVMLFHFKTKVRFVIDGQNIDREIVVNKKKHDFYFALKKKPQIVRFDPEYGLLAKVKFNKPTEMLYAQLENHDDVIGRILACEVFKEKKDKETVKKVKKALNCDPFYGVRIEASRVLQEMHTDEAYEALVESLDQPDARVRSHVSESIGAFYRTESFEKTKQIISSEKNPAIVGGAIRNLGRYHSEDSRQIIIKYLDSESYRNYLAVAAVRAIDRLKDPSYIEVLHKTLFDRQQEFRSWYFGYGLKTLARISSDEDDKTEVFEFISAYVNHDNENVKAAAIEALGLLGDKRAIAIVETFSDDPAEDRIEYVALAALKRLQKETKHVSDEVVALREIVNELKKDNKTVAEELEEMKKRLDAKELGQKDLLSVISEWALEQDNENSVKEPNDASDIRLEN